MTVLRAFRKFIENGFNLVCVDGVVADSLNIVFASDTPNSKVDRLVLFLQIPGGLANRVEKIRIGETETEEDERFRSRQPPEEFSEQSPVGIEASVAVIGEGNIGGRVGKCAMEMEDVPVSGEAVVTAHEFHEVREIPRAYSLIGAAEDAVDLFQRVIEVQGKKMLERQRTQSQKHGIWSLSIRAKLGLYEVRESRAEILSQMLGTV